MLGRFRIEGLWLALLLVALAIVYVPSLGNRLVFDDEYLASGRLFADYAAWLELRTRMLSYGSFVWVRDTFGDSYAIQRAINAALHAAVVVSLWAFYREILKWIQPIDVGVDREPMERSPALVIGIGFFALNPVAVYAVAYLIQRSIVMATLFTILGLWAFMRGIERRSAAMLGVAVSFYVLAVASKEHALLAPLAAVPLYILVARPGPRRLAWISVVAVTLIAIAGTFLWRRYGEVIGKPFDEFSHVYLRQLDALRPGAESHALGLSILNQAYIFFQYGLRWMLPASEWLSINLRPPFPLSFGSFPHVLGPLGYLAAVAGGFFLLLRHRDWRALLGVSLLLPALLFATEFATVWVQDPFVLYRSYLWAIGIPGLLILLFHGTPPRALLAIAVVGGGLLLWQALDRVFSLATPQRAWSDAIRKLPDDPRSVGRWFPYLNRGSAYVDAREYNLAMQDFEISSRLGDMGLGTFNRGALFAANGEHAKALASFAHAEREGYNLYNLPFQRGLSLMALGRPSEAFAQFVASRSLGAPSPTRELILLNMGKAALQLSRPDDAIAALRPLLAAEPANREARYLLGMAHVMRRDYEAALEALDAVMEEAPTAPAHYARALAHYGLGRKGPALQDIDAAIRLGLDTPHHREWRGRIQAMK